MASMAVALACSVRETTSPTAEEIAEYQRRNPERQPGLTPNRPGERVPAEMSPRYLSKPPGPSHLATQRASRVACETEIAAQEKRVRKAATRLALAKKKAEDAATRHNKTP